MPAPKSKYSHVCKFNSVFAWTQEDWNDMARIRNLRLQLETVQKHIDKGTGAEKGPWYWSAEKQQLEEELKILLSKKGPRLVK